MFAVKGRKMIALLCVFAENVSAQIKMIFVPPVDGRNAVIPCSYVFHDDKQQLIWFFADVMN